MAPIKTHADVPGSSPQLRDALRGAASAHKENGPVRGAYRQTYGQSPHTTLRHMTPAVVTTTRR